MDDTSERMDAVIDKLRARTLEQADRYAIDQMRTEMVARIKAVQPTKKMCIRDRNNGMSLQLQTRERSSWKNMEVWQTL